MLNNKKNILLDSESIKRTVVRLAHEILEKNDGASNIFLVGILTRGEPLALRLKKNIKKISNEDVLIGSLDITFHRDDYRDRLLIPQIKGSSINSRVDNKIVVLVDDVLFTGRTIRAAMDELNAFGRPKKVQLAVLVDRGHRELPIRADFVGNNIPTNEGEHIKVLLQEVDGEDSVFLTKSAKSK